MRTEQSLLDRLSTHQLELVDLVYKGLSNREAASQLGLTPGSVKVKLGRIYSKLGLVRPRPRLALILWYHASMLDRDRGLECDPAEPGKSALVS
jgi:DNA-binding NarL/FixJ family response regulator